MMEMEIEIEMDLFGGGINYDGKLQTTARRRSGEDAIGSFDKVERLATLTWHRGLINCQNCSSEKSFNTSFAVVPNYVLDSFIGNSFK